MNSIAPKVCADLHAPLQRNQARPRGIKPQGIRNSHLPQTPGGTEVLHSLASMRLSPLGCQYGDEQVRQVQARAQLLAARRGFPQASEARKDETASRGRSRLSPVSTFGRSGLIPLLPRSALTRYGDESASATGGGLEVADDLSGIVDAAGSGVDDAWEIDIHAVVFPETRAEEAVPILS